MTSALSFRLIAPFILVLCLFISLPLPAQNIKRVELISKVFEPRPQSMGKKRKEFEEKPMKSYMCGFFEKSAAESFQKKVNSEWNQTHFSQKDLQAKYKENCDAFAITDNNGRAAFEILIGGYVVCIPLNADLDPKSQVITSSGRCYFEFQSSEDAFLMKEHTQTAKRTREKFKKGRPISIGRRMYLPSKMYPIDEKYCRSNGRFGLAISFICLEDKDTLCRWRPFLKDGESFHVTQNRRMGFDMMQNDSLAKFVQHDNPLQPHEENEVYFGWDLLKPEGCESKHYRALADVWAEDYNGTFYKDTVEVSEGFDRMPLRFLDFKIENVPIVKERYKIEGKAQEHKGELALHFAFVRGQAELADDSINRIEKERARRSFMEAYGDANNFMQGVVVKGNSSPDGSNATNERLSRERAGTIANWIRSISGYGNIKVENYVATWNDVADTLAAMGEHQKAEEIRAIARAHKTTEQQNPFVARLPYYQNYLEAHILPKFRAVNFKFSYLVKRPLNPEEVYAKYEHEPSYRSTIKEAYEYYYLFDYLQQRPQELEQQAKQAYENIKDVNRPWPLAGYVYATCLNKRSKPNTDILIPFFDFNIAKNNVERFDENYNIQWWNDDAIVVAEIGAYCGKGDYGKAAFIALNYLEPDNEKYDILRLFMRCYDRQYDNPQVIDGVASTSPFNAAVIYAAQDETEDTVKLGYLRKAITLLSDTTKAEMREARAYYLRGTLGYRLYLQDPKHKGFLDGKFFTPGPKFTFNREEELRNDPELTEHTLDQMEQWAREDFEREPKDMNQFWGYLLLRACQMNPELHKSLPYDGYFERPLKRAFSFFWKGMQNGKDLYELAKEWDAKSIEEKI